MLTYCLELVLRAGGCLFWRWLCCPETGCSEAQYLWFSQRSQDCGIQHDNDTSFKIYIDGRWYCHHTIIHISSIWQWNLYLNHLESMNDLCFLCSIRYLRATCLSCNHVSTRLHTSWRAWLPEQFASSRHSIDPLSPEPRISAHSAIKSNIIHTNPNLSLKKKPAKKKKRHEATYISNLRTYRFHLKCPEPKLQVSVSETPPSDACVEGHQDLSLPIFAGSHWRPLSEILRTAVKMMKGIQTS